MQMPWNSEHTKWLRKLPSNLQTADGREVELWEFRHEEDPDILSKWAKHFRNHYCLDEHIDRLRPKNKTKKDFLNEIKFPGTENLGPAIRAGDFGEILVTDYLRWKLNFQVFRLRWNSKFRNESQKGCDVIGFKFDRNNPSPNDILAIFETKTKFSKSKKNRFQNAINDSAKDNIRIGESLSFLKQKVLDNEDQVQLIERFQNPVDNVYAEMYGAVAIYCEKFFEKTEVEESTTLKVPKPGKSKVKVKHPKRDVLRLIVIKGKNMMNLVNKLYEIAADEA